MFAASARNVTSGLALPLSQPVERSRSSYLSIGIVLIFFSLIRLCCMAMLPLAPDEAYYWDWSRSLDWGYFDHPPMVAWLISATTACVGNTTIGIRLVPWLSGILGQLACTAIAKHLGFSRASIIVLIVAFHAVIISSVGLLLATPDAPLVLFWTLAMLLGYRALFAPFKGVWIVLGIVCGCGLLSKYTFALFFVSGATFLALTPLYRRMIIDKRVWFSVLIAVGIFLPNVLWNASKGWVSYLFQLRHGLQARGWGRVDLLGEYIAGQIGVVTPLVIVAIGVACWRAAEAFRHDVRLGYLVVHFCVPLAAFGLSSLSKKVEVNWPAVAYAAGFLLLCWQWETAGRGWRKYVVVSLVASALCSAVVVTHAIHPFLPIPIKKDPTSQLRGWKEFGGKAGEVVSRVDPQRRMLLCTNRYQDAAMLAFYMPGQPQVRALNVGSRPNQYDFVEKENPSEGRAALLFLPIKDPRFEERISILHDAQRVDTIQLDRGRGKSISYLIIKGVIRKTSGNKFL